jgi:Endonuclease V
MLTPFVTSGYMPLQPAARPWRGRERSGILRSVETGTSGGGVFVAADVHYLASGGARAAAVVAADTAFSRLIADRIAVVPEVEPYQPGRFYLRELPPLRAVLDGLAEMAVLIIDGYADLDPDGPPPARCTSRPPGCPAPTPPTSSGTWPASTGCLTPCVAPIASPAMACRSRRDAEGRRPIAALSSTSI